MDNCHTCGNSYDKPMRITKGGKEYVFDSFECAVHALAPACDHCGCRILGHGIEAGTTIFCCAHCARLSGVAEARDRASG